MQTVYAINIGGQNIASVIAPYLISVTVTDKSGSSSDSCEIKLDDSDGQLMLPEDGREVSVLLGDERGVALVFQGTVDEVHSQCSASEGMVLSVTAKGVDTKGKAKEPKQKHWDNKALSDVVSEAAQAAGLSAQVAPSLASIQRPYWAMQNESFIHFGERLAREVGGTFKVSGTKAVIAERNGGTTASGATMPTITAAHGDNLIGWDIAPTLNRHRWKEVKVRHYDKKAAKWVVETEQVEDAGAVASHTHRHAAADQGEAKQRAKSHKKDAEREKGGGTITIEGSTLPQPEGNVILVGARPGIDGTYRIESVVHEFSSESGWTTRLELKQPQGASGKDTRKARKK